MKPSTRTELIASYAYGRSYWADVSKEERENSKTMEDESYPINKCTGEGPSVESAVKAVGRGGADHDKIRRHIISAAGDLGCSDLIPDNWNSDGSLRESASAAEAEALAADPGAADDAADDRSISEAIDQAIALQEKDPDGDKDPNDVKVLAALKEAKAAQEADVAGEASVPAKPSGKGAEKDAQSDGYAAAPSPEPPGRAAKPTTSQEGKKGPENGAICTNADCGHPAAMHANGEAGDNTGPCSAPDCKCPEMTVGSAEGLEGDNAMAAAGIPASPPGAAPTQEGAAAQDLNAPPAVEGGDAMGPAFSIPVLIIEGQETSDGRQIAVGALSWRTPPLPLMYLATETHDPSGFDPNAPAVIAGRIDELSRVDGEGDTALICAKGFFLPNEDGMEAAKVVEAMGRAGVSGDVAVQATEITSVEVDEMGFPTGMSEVLTEATIMGATICPFPAFEGAYIVLGDGTDGGPQAIPQRTDEDSPLVASAHFMTYEECAPCQQGFDVIAAAGGPVRPPAVWFENPHFAEGDGRLVEILDRRGKRVLGGKFACPLTVTEEGRVYGHIAPWDVCHTGHTGQCILAPHSGVDYAHFRRGQITTAEGSKVRVGVLTAETGHATTRPGVRGFTASEAIAHYDNTALQAAYVNIGEDEHGIWVAGAVCPDVTEAQVQKLRASSVSGDWRNVGGQLELVAALAVNHPGYPLTVVENGRHASLVAAGATVMDRLKNPTESETGLPRWAEGPLMELAAARAREKIAALG